MRNGFCVFDSRGLDYDRVAEGLDEVAEWMEDGVRHRQICRSSGVPDHNSSSAASAAAKRFVRRRVNCVVVVANVSEIYRSLAKGDGRPLQATRDLFHAPSIKSCCSYAFVYFEDECDAEYAIRSLDNIHFGYDKRRLSVEWSRVIYMLLLPKCKILDRVVSVEYAPRDNSERGERHDNPRRVGYGRHDDGPYEPTEPTLPPVPSEPRLWSSPYERYRSSDYRGTQSRSPVQRPKT